MKVITIWSIENKLHTTYANRNKLDDVTSTAYCHCRLVALYGRVNNIFYYTTKHSMAKFFDVMIENQYQQETFTIAAITLRLVYHLSSNSFNTSKNNKNHESLVLECLAVYSIQSQLLEHM